MTFQRLASFLFVLLLTACGAAKQQTPRSQFSGTAGGYVLHGHFLSKAQFVEIINPPSALKKPWYRMFKDLKKGNCFSVPELGPAGPCLDAQAKAQVANSALKGATEVPYIYGEDAAEACRQPSCTSNPSLKEYCDYYVERANAEVVNDSQRHNSQTEIDGAFSCLAEIYGF